MKVYAPATGTILTFTHTKPFYVIDDLSQLNGLASGIIHLPLLIDWSPSSGYDLSQIPRVRTMYSHVLREAKSEHDLARYLNLPLLRAVWADLRIPAFIREAWEQQHQEIKNRQ